MGSRAVTWPFYSERVTVCDVLDAGACIDGVRKFVAAVKVIAGRVTDYASERWVCIASNGYGYGYGDGYGYGYGDGAGTGASPPG